MPRPLKPVKRLTDEQRSLVTRYIRIVTKMTHRYGRLELEDRRGIAFVALCRAAQDFRPEFGSKFSTHAIGTIRYALLDAAKYATTIRISYHERDSEAGRRAAKVSGGVPDVLTVSDDPAVALDRQDWHRRFRAAVELLDDRGRLLVSMRLAGFDNQTIADALECSRDTVHRLLRQYGGQIAAAVGCPVPLRDNSMHATSQAG